jgi:hypothetical protein
MDGLTKMHRYLYLVVVYITSSSFVVGIVDIFDLFISSSGSLASVYAVSSPLFGFFFDKSASSSASISIVLTSVSVVSSSEEVHRRPPGALY